MIREQGVFNPVTGDNITGDYATNAKEELNKELEELRNFLREEIVSGTKSQVIKKEIISRAESVFSDYYDSLKQPVNKEVLEKARRELEEDIKVYLRLFNELKVVGEKSEKHGLAFEITLKPELSFHFGWVADKEGFWIQFNRDNKPHSLIYALPLTHLKTDAYGPYFIGGIPPAARLVLVTENMMLFASQDNAPPSDLIKELTPKQEIISGVVPLLSGKKKGSLIDFELTDPSCVDCAAEPSNKEILETVFKELPKVKAVGIVTAGHPKKEVFIKDA